MNYIIRPKASIKIRQFYKNVSKKYKNTYSLEMMNKNIDETINAIYQIENGLMRRQPTISRWQGLYMATSKNRKWNFAYRIDGDTIYVEDACHAQNMHESKLKRELFIEKITNTMKTQKKVIRITESDLHLMIEDAVKTALNEIGDTPKGAYDLGRLYDRFKTKTAPTDKDIKRRKEFEEYLDSLSFDDIPRRRAFDRGRANQYFASNTTSYPEDRAKAYRRMVNDRNNADNLGQSFSGREFRSDWTYK